MSHEKISVLFHDQWNLYPDGAMVGAIIEAKMPRVKYFRMPNPELHKSLQDTFCSDLEQTINNLGIIIRRTFEMFEEEVSFAVIATRQQIEEVAKIESVYRIRPDVAVTVRKPRETTNRHSPRSWFRSLFGYKS